MTSKELRERTMLFALAIFKFARPMSQDRMSSHVALQLFRAATAVAANYRAACLGRSRAEFVAKLGVVREESDEAEFWLEFARRSGLARESDLTSLTAESKELAALFAASYRTAKSSAVASTRPRIAK
jgi:four helix bundle protein